jgi:hypothetical protein
MIGSVVQVTEHLPSKHKALRNIFLEDSVKMAGILQYF